MFYDSMESPIGRIYLLADEGGLKRLNLSLPGHPFNPASSWQHRPDAMTIYRTQLTEYFQHQREHFDCPMSPEGTIFQKQVWQVLKSIPYGETMSYGQIAALLGKPNAARAVGMANNVNPIPLMIPCHRVIGANGDLVGYRYGLEIKQKLLSLEQKQTELQWPNQA
ncbi:Methylated-DNA--protein-cysteine methyltransferase [Vibrio stylophorae]|uniref:Methylated-DNA--protein-cysteine methyltransferase n=1 Tax=Vibrio stylophorae TaxID=659351 RepID=A0ABN8DWN0_9VIBR|nr:methylated-DNA--[protein]-cysteine S-methyltransferase [Vibrio stylophorae]CAH0533772.1 Methylated-DNA--protein-cysteine methyltransferase [Vibrio stylophorae]